MSGSHPLWRRGRLGDRSRWAERRRRQARAIANEETENAAFRSRGTGREQALPALAPERFAHALIGAPGAAAGSGRVKADLRQPVGVAQVGNAQRRNAKAPHVARQGVQRRQAAFGEVAIPLGPERLLVTRQVQRIYDRAALPAVVLGRDGPPSRIGAVGNVAQPGARRIECPQFERQRRRP